MDEGPTGKSTIAEFLYGTLCYLLQEVSLLSHCQFQEVMPTHERA